MGYSAVCVVDFADLAEAVSLDTPERAQWLEVAQFQTEVRAKQFQKDFMSLARSDELDHITGPALAGVIADDLEMDSRWQTMDRPALEKLRVSEWGVIHAAGEWQSRMDETSPTQAIDAVSIDLDI